MALVDACVTGHDAPERLTQPVRMLWPVISLRTLLPPVVRFAGCLALVAALVLMCPQALRAAAPEQPPRHFAIDEFRVEGNTLLPAEEIEAAVYDFLGPDLDRR